ncbi:hypothetical protein EDEG_03919 [Edhazardia aedis USNM 41457]|uniref:Uncharacterized protein n=1 Tax=Edhazardia aedis (strain USNM 41457) TaxID=1003232 RepID=J9DJF0_EDHAE|nr:hypothetical protein EDEG_03919 [Edhazardia aedis USNM 41457]|eukprot:EJW01502.1 hypothetical protein EDEG_03919 [Edhazardia aedis USNM 41457]
MMLKNLVEITNNKYLIQCKIKLKNFLPEAEKAHNSLNLLLETYKRTTKSNLNEAFTEAKNVLEEQKYMLDSQKSILKFRNAEKTPLDFYSEMLKLSIKILNDHDFKPPQLLATNAVLDQYIINLKYSKYFYELYVSWQKLINLIDFNLNKLFNFYDGSCILRNLNNAKSLVDIESIEEVLKNVVIILEILENDDNFNLNGEKHKIRNETYKILNGVIEKIICTQNLLLNSQITKRGIERSNKVRFDLLDSLFEFQILLQTQNYKDYQEQKNPTCVIANFLAKISEEKSALKTEEVYLQEKNLNTCSQDSINLLEKFRQENSNFPNIQELNFIDLLKIFLKTGKYLFAIHTEKDNMKISEANESTTKFNGIVKKLFINALRKLENEKITNNVQKTVSVYYEKAKNDYDSAIEGFQTAPKEQNEKERKILEKTATELLFIFIAKKFVFTFPNNEENHSISVLKLCNLLYRCCEINSSEQSITCSNCKNNYAERKQKGKVIENILSSDLTQKEQKELQERNPSQSSVPRIEGHKRSLLSHDYPSEGKKSMKLM